MKEQTKITFELESPTYDRTLEKTIVNVDLCSNCKNKLLKEFPKK